MRKKIKYLPHHLNHSVMQNHRQNERHGSVQGLMDVSLQNLRVNCNHHRHLSVEKIK